MSIAALSWAKKQKCGSASLKAVLLAVADYADETGYAWPSQKRIVEDTELSLRTVRDALVALEEKGLLRRVQYNREDGSRGADRYYLNLKQEAEIAAPPATVAGGVRQPLPGAPAVIAGLTTFEPSIDPSVEPLIGDAGASTGQIIPFKPKAEAKLNVKGTRIPDDWTPTPELIEFGISLGFSHATTVSELAGMHDYFLAASGPNAVKRDWNAAGRNWLRKAANGFGGSRGSSPSGHGSPSGGRFGAMQRALAKVAHSDPLPE